MSNNQLLDAPIYTLQTASFNILSSLIGMLDVRYILTVCKGSSITVYTILNSAQNVYSFQHGWRLLFFKHKIINL